MKRKCPKCVSNHPRYSTHGSFVRNADNRKLVRFKCSLCFTTFSEASSQACYRQKRRDLNPRIRELLCSGVSQRRIARLLKTTRLTVARKLVFLAKQARLKNKRDLEKLATVEHFQFDDLETIEHTKCKPLSVIMAVEKSSRQILGFRVSQMPAKGHLAAISRKKYGYREDHRYIGRRKLFEALLPKVSPTAVIESDESPHYTEDVKKWFPKATHKPFKGVRGCVAGQGELKKQGYDPLFSLNHTFAMLRANINRLFRKTWCTTKTPQRLVDHLELYVNYHNQILIKSK